MILVLDNGNGVKNMSQEKLNTIAIEITRAFAKIGISGRGTKAKIAKICGVTNAAVGAWFHAHNPKQPSIDSLVKISKVTNTSLEQLIRGREALDSIPMLEMGELPHFLQQNQEAEISYRLLSEIMHDESGNIAVIAGDDSMMHLGTINYYPKGAILVFRISDAKPQHEDFVLVKVTIQGRDFFMFRQYLENAGKESFVALNPAYENITEFDRYEVIGYFSYQIIK